MSSFEYKINKASIRDIEMHLNKCSRIFSPPLDTYVDIHKYAKKIRLNSVTVEAWLENEVIGLIGCYLNNKEILSGYITNLSVRQDYQNNGIALKLVELTIKEALKLKFKTITLEVDVENSKVIEIYKRSGFVLSSRVGSKYIMINRLLENKDVLVSICCITYNHVSYISEAIEGFLMQKTTFPYEILIHDDASFDGTAEIIRGYENRFPNIIKPIYQKENQYSQERGISVTYQFPRARGKYIALCEGDDYWTDPYKLQKQVDFLENNPEYSLCVSGYTEYNLISDQKRVIISKIKGLEKNPHGFTFSLNEMKSSWLTKTLTSVFRSEVLGEVDFSNYKFSRDNHLFYHLVKEHKAFYYTENFAVYRIHNKGIHSSNFGINNMIMAYSIYKELYERNYDDFTRVNYMNSMLILFNHRIFVTSKINIDKSTFQLFKESIFLIRKLNEILYFIKALLPRWLIEKVKRNFLK